MTQPVNPLQQYFRQPALYIKLPSLGHFWPQDSLVIPPNNEFPVLPMTALDEISYRTPDALFNGSAVVNVIQSCLPNIKNAWNMPSIDLNTVLGAIRIASYGSEMELKTKCPNCEAVNEYTVDLHGVLEQIAPTDFSQSMSLGDIEIFFRPISYKDQNTINLMQFEQQKILQQLPNGEMPEDERAAMFDKTLKEIARITTLAVTFSIASIRTPQALVSEPAFIEEFLKNCGGEQFKRIRDHVINLRGKEEIKPIPIDCPECTHHYEQAFVLDTALFFDNAS